MRKDFEVGQSNELVQADRVFDLHNQYDFSGISIGSDQTVRMVFQPNEVHGRGLPKIWLEFGGVDCLLLSPGFGTRPTADLDEMGYMLPDQDDDRWLSREGQATEADHLVFRLGLDYVRIHADRAQLTCLAP